MLFLVGKVHFAILVKRVACIEHLNIELLVFFLYPYSIV